MKCKGENLIWGNGKIKKIDIFHFGIISTMVFQKVVHLFTKNMKV